MPSYVVPGRHAPTVGARARVFCGWWVFSGYGETEVHSRDTAFGCVARSAGMQKREGRERKYMGIDDSASGRNSTEADSAVDDMMDMAAESVNEGFTDQQIDQLKDNTQAVTQREHEITNIVSVCPSPSTTYAPFTCCERECVGCRGYFGKQDKRSPQSLHPYHARPRPTVDSRADDYLQRFGTAYNRAGLSPECVLPPRHATYGT